MTAKGPCKNHTLEDEGKTKGESLRRALLFLQMIKTEITGDMSLLFQETGQFGGKPGELTRAASNISCNLTKSVTRRPSEARCGYLLLTEMRTHNSGNILGKKAREEESEKKKN